MENHSPLETRCRTTTLHRGSILKLPRNSAIIAKILLAILQESVYTFHEKKIALPSDSGLLSFSIYFKEEVYGKSNDEVTDCGSHREKG
jgi:hypothetical protein